MSLLTMSSGVISIQATLSLMSEQIVLVSNLHLPYIHIYTNIGKTLSESL